VRKINAIHRRAQATGNPLSTMIRCSGCLLGEAMDQVNLGADPHCDPAGRIRLLDDVRGAAGVVSFLDDFEAALRMHHHLDADTWRGPGRCARGGRAGGTEQWPFQRTKSALRRSRSEFPPRSSRGSQQPFCQRIAHGVRGVSAEVLVGEEENLDFGFWILDFGLV